MCETTVVQKRTSRKSPRSVFFYGERCSNVSAPLEGKTQTSGRDAKTTNHQPTTVLLCCCVVSLQQQLYCTVTERVTVWIDCNHRGYSSIVSCNRGGYSA